MDRVSAPGLGDTPEMVMNKVKLPKPLTDWHSEPQISELREDLEFARQSNSEHTANVNEWMSLKDCVKTRPKGERASSNRSEVQPKLVRKHLEWQYSTLSEPFLDNHQMFDLRPRTPEDADGAHKNQIILNWQMDTKLNKVRLIDTTVRTLLNEGTAVIRVGWDRKTEKVLSKRAIYDYYSVDPGVIEEMERRYQEDPNQLSEEDMASLEYSNTHGQPVMAVMKGEEEYHEERLTDNCPSARVIDSRNLYVDPGCLGVVEDARYMIYSYESTRSDLLKRGIYKNLEAVDWVKVSEDVDADHTSSYHTAGEDTRRVRSKRSVTVYEYWGEWDIHGDGRTSSIVATWIGDVLIQLEENPFPDKKPPFIVISCMPVPRSVYGEAVASLLADNQQISGAITRGMIDLMGRSANAQTGYSKDFLDPTNKAKFAAGRDFEFNLGAPPEVSIRQMTYPEIPQSAYSMLQMQNSEAESVSGIKAFAGGISGEAYGQVARGISGALDAANLREMGQIRRLAEGFRQMGVKIIAMNAVYLSEEEQVRVTNDEFIAVSKEDLKVNCDTIVDISSAKADESKAQDLGFILQTMGPTLDLSMTKIVLVKIAYLKHMPELAKMIEEYEPQPDPMEEAMKKAELEKLQADTEFIRAETQKMMAETQSISNASDLEVSGVKHARNIQAQQAQAAGNRDLEVTKQMLNPETPVDRLEAGLGLNAVIDQQKGV